MERERTTERFRGLFRYLRCRRPPRFRRRVAKKVNGAIVRRWIYKNQLQPAAEFDGSGTLLARYLDGVVIKGATSYRLVEDQLGTPRLLVNSATGAVAQRLDLDEWGQVTADSSAGFQVFGLAGGIYDSDTGLVRFGARDYDPLVGRWTAKDPILFRGGDTNLYGYVLGDPINRFDSTGLDSYLIDEPGILHHQAVAFDIMCHADCTPADPIVERIDYACAEFAANCAWGAPPWSNVEVGSLSQVSKGASAVTQFPMSCEQTAAARDKTIAECNKPYNIFNHNCRDVSQGGTQ
jgi:RHS repeat-associated protein